MDTRLSDTASLCPVCLSKIPASRIQRNNKILLIKQCEKHGLFESVVWSDADSYAAWHRQQTAPKTVQSKTTDNCPYDCGLCCAHQQNTCCALLEVTRRCDLACPICYAGSCPEADTGPSLKELEHRLAAVARGNTRINIQLSGGEPCVRDDLPDIVRLIREMNFPFVQLNTNGIRISRDTKFLARLRKAGLSTVFLQFDGTHNAVYRKIRGRNLFEIKQAAVANCLEHQLGVVLVPTLVPGVNTGNIGKIISFALEQTPGVRGIHFQPLSYFGRYPLTSGIRSHITLPEVMRLIEEQSKGQISVSHFRPPAGPHPSCSFRATFVYMKDGSLQPLSDNSENGCCPGEAAESTRAFVARQWAYPETRTSADKPPSESLGGWEPFLSRVRTHTFSISAMAFQDAWTLDLERLRQCYLHVIRPNGRLVPFCAYNLTAVSGNSLYRGDGP